MQKKTRAFLKWAGGKYSLVDDIAKRLDTAQALTGNRATTLVEPFVGAGSVFLNTHFDHYVLNDINADLINLYRELTHAPDEFISDARKLFSAVNNDADIYYGLRKQFNASRDAYERAILFLYMNRHGYNGLCRYNLKGIFNVPFGKYKKPYFPEKEMYFFAEKAQRATFTCLSYKDVFAQLPKNAVVYCDPPYVPLSKTASFTSYAKGGFNLDDQANLANLAEQAAGVSNTSVLISNHDTLWTRKIYEQASIDVLNVKRTISPKGHARNKVSELMAMYLSGRQYQLNQTKHA
ncbi:MULTISPECIES: Dam family site-specific DNA-(adenine-N6)-methyltransferase [Pseudoalteromonas]|uniref:Site-specific DNA-methyltransferase (adenine-specific) n=1 Tax=Pseudoalteromonas ruthenica TaxID=151081 RepID=A0A0F4Q300_9GAMM|nr:MULTISPECIES: Dam family site-specific DNA-(adenine-N6)-methyltransferase [Pseudoalteromonas]KJY97718.1 DNA adenine methylase [Pseudoalteromonas ruthenica]KJZ01745.1 DNA adenine methylase [Pseudoalteromonas ruthenica]MCF2862625.1 Dam family site-specific DNA-(adenine-N6)-methyltransferase [Pseudoalteromonas sp. CNAT2-18]MCG7543212.1 Dam family site-specific DNA-(adenine-N6)-methyltransferase [Pseudoalteromonas sp. MM17-2]MCG7558923.1 Dam family site-specific DNA-(adenine-N6)-methyltransfera|tara:strand:- start:8620 stop:9498 length:879 start_codon:yes stop_codon:yes gene_type:complete